MRISQPKQASSILETTSLAIRVGVRLIEQLNAGPRADSRLTQTLFRNLRTTVGALPTTSYLSAELPKNIAKWPDMVERGEFKAARYQIVLLIRKLKLYREDWA
jgi:hypothetical protein